MFAIWSAGKWFGIQWVWWAVAGLVLLLGVFGILNGLLNRVYRPVDGLVQGVVGRMGSGKSLFIVQRVLIPYCGAVGKRGFLNSATKRPMVRAVTNFRFAAPGDVEIRTVEPQAEFGIFRSLIELADDIGQTEGPWFDYDGVMHNGRNQYTGEIEPMPEHPPRELEDGRWAFVRQPILNALVILDEMHLFANSNNVALGEDASYIISMARKLNCELWWLSQHEMKVHKRLRDESSSIWLAGKVHNLMAPENTHVCREYLSPSQVEMARQAAGTDRAPRANDKRMYRYTAKVGLVYNSFELLVPDPRRPTRRGDTRPKTPGRIQHHTDAPEPTPEHGRGRGDRPLADVAPAESFTQLSPPVEIDTNQLT